MTLSGNLWNSLRYEETVLCVSFCPLDWDPQEDHSYWEGGYPGPGIKEHHIPSEPGWTFSFIVISVPGGWFLLKGKLEWWGWPLAGAQRRESVESLLEFEPHTLTLLASSQSNREKWRRDQLEMTLALAMLHLSSAPALIPGFPPVQLLCMQGLSRENTMPWALPIHN